LSPCLLVPLSPPLLALFYTPHSQFFYRAGATDKIRWMIF
jgi:hypothetical protein